MACRFETPNVIAISGSPTIAHNCYAVRDNLQHIFQFWLYFQKTQLVKLKTLEGLHRRHYATAKLTCDLLVAWFSAWWSFGVSNVAWRKQICGDGVTWGTRAYQCPLLVVGALGTESSSHLSLDRTKAIGLVQYSFICPLAKYFKKWPSTFLLTWFLRIDLASARACHSQGQGKVHTRVKDRDGLTIYKCHRGTPANKRLHQKIQQPMRGFVTPLCLAYVLLTDFFCLESRHWYAHSRLGKQTSWIVQWWAHWRRDRNNGHVAQSRGATASRMGVDQVCWR